MFFSSLHMKVLARVGERGVSLAAPICLFVEFPAFPFVALSKNVL